MPNLLHQAGFTLIELLAVVVILGLLAAVAIPNLGKFSDTQNIENEKNKLIADLRQAQTNAQNGLKCDPTEAALSWKVLFDETRYRVVGVCQYSSNFGTNSKDIVNLKTVTLNTPCNIDNELDGANKGEVSFTSSTFGSSNVILPYDPILCVAGYNGATYTLTLTSIDSPDIYTIVVDKGGAIYEQ